MRSASGMNSLHNRITSGVQRSAASEACAAAGLVPAATINTVSTPAIAHRSDRDWRFENSFTLVPCSIEVRCSFNMPRGPMCSGRAGRLLNQYRAEIGSSSAGNSEISLQPLSVTTTSSSMRAAE